MAEQSEPELVDFRCPGCDRLLLKVAPKDGTEFEVKCPRSDCARVTRAVLNAEQD